MLVDETLNPVCAWQVDKQKDHGTLSQRCSFHGTRSKGKRTNAQGREIDKESEQRGMEKHSTFLVKGGNGGECIVEDNINAASSKNDDDES